ncbi:MAG: sulfotransferase domain-containing protein [Pseudomonadota bacterium]
MRHLVNHVSRFKLQARTDEKGILERAEVDQYGAPWDAEMAKDWDKGGGALRNYRRLSKALDWYQIFLRGPINDDWYRSLFKQVPNRKWAVDFSTTGYLCGNSGMRDMANFAKDNRAVLILRDPIDRLWSHIRFHAELSGELDDLRTWSYERIWEFIEDFDLHKSSLYADGVEGMIKHFPENKRMIINFSDLKDRPEELYADILELLELKQIELPTRAAKDQRMNVAKEIPLPPGLFAPYVDLFLEDIGRLEDMGLSFVAPWRETVLGHQDPKWHLRHSASLRARSSWRPNTGIIARLRGTKK